MTFKICIILALVAVGICFIDMAVAKPSGDDVTATTTRGATEKCPRGLSYKVDCNTCHCNPENGISGCTLIGCLTRSNRAATTTGATEKCPKGLTYKVKCNTCSCNPKTGHSRCTEKACLTRPIRDLPDDVTATSTGITEKCPKGLSFKVDCNSCHCNPDNGVSLCTAKACMKRPIQEQPDDVTAATPTGATEKCPRGLNYKEECNFCSCNPETGLSGCTYRGCPTRPTRDVSDDVTTATPTGATEKCPQGVTYKKDCNTCRCNPDTGDEIWCTRRGCPTRPNRDVSDDVTAASTSATEKCPRGLNYKEECNTCGCNPENGLSWCTKKGCIKRPIQDQPDDVTAASTSATEKCPEGISFKRDCNTCGCNPDNGNSWCTLKGCHGPVLNQTLEDTTATPSGASEKCPEGTSFKRDCNTCGCDPETGSSWCTQIGCLGLVRDIQDITAK